MEDYQAAFLQRSTDVSTLDTNGRQIAAMHIGGITIECLLKYMLTVSSPTGPIKEWKTELNNPGHSITNPGHSYKSALMQNRRLRDRIQRFPEVRQWLEDVENPGRHFIDMRYQGKEPDAIDYQKWHKSYKRLMRWLQNQGT